MTPRRCVLHEQLPGEVWDSVKYKAVWLDSKNCWRCRLWAAVARVAHRIDVWLGRVP